MRDEIIKKRLILNLEVKDLLKDMNIIDGINKEYNDKDISSMDELSFLNLEIECIKDIRTRLENIFKD